MKTHLRFPLARAACTGLLLLAAGVSGPDLAAQEPIPSADPGGVDLLGAAAFRVPIHTAPDDPIGGAYGTWAAEDSYKVAFDGGMEFHPAVGRAEAGPLSWRTVVVEVGGERLPDAQPVRRHTDWRFEYDHGSYLEAYDLRPDGVEQTFVFPKLPAGGDLLIRGKIETGLRAEPQPERHGALDFHDAEGRAVLRYGAATVFDARGRSLPMTTRFDGTCIELRVPAAWLAEATFPVTVDPLVQNLLVRQSSGYPIDVEIARDDESNELLIAYSRWIGNDVDGYVLLFDDDYSNPTLIYSDVTSSWKAKDIKAGFVGGADHWLMAYTRQFSSTVSAIRYRNHPKGLRQSSTTVSFLSMPGGLDAYAPDLGGTAAFSTGSEGLVVFSAGDLLSEGISDDTEAYGVLIDASTLTAGTPFFLDASGGSTTGGRNREREYPCVIPESGGGTDAWIVGWQEFDDNIGNDDWDIYVSRVSSAGQPTAARALGQSQQGRHSLAPKLAGRDGRYMVGFAARDNTSISGHPAANQVFAQRFNWASGLFPASSTPRLVRESFNGVLFPQGMSYDNVSESHWTFVTQGMSPHQVVYADVLGHRAGVCQALTVSPVVGNTDFSPAITFDDDQRRFRVVYGGTHQQVRGDSISYFDATTALYGIGCGAGQIGSQGVPDKGSEFFRVRLHGVPVGTSAFLNLSFGPSSMSLDAIGGMGCFVNTNMNLFVTSFGRVTDGGGAEVQLPLPAPIHGDLFAQWVYLSPGANALGVETSQGLRIEVR
jgi:hypothetical protein